MKKRLLSTILATAMVFSLAACGTANETQQAPAAEEAPAADAAENETEESADVAEDAATEGEAAD